MRIVEGVLDHVAQESLAAMGAGKGRGRKNPLKLVSNRGAARQARVRLRGSRFRKQQRL
jgi:hypothetical protein